MTIRAPKPEDAVAVAALYNHYVLHSTASFETEPLDAEQMRSRLESAIARLVCEREGAIVGFAIPTTGRNAQPTGTRRR